MSMVEERGRSQVLDWDAPRDKRASLTRPLVTLLLPLVVFALIAGSFVGPSVGVGLALLAGGGLTLWIMTEGSRIRKAMELTHPEEGSRLMNLVKGLSSDLEIGAPKVWTIRSQEPNAITFWSRGANLAVTEGLLDTFTRTETEAVIAHCLVRVRDEKAVPTRLVSLARLGLKPYTGDAHHTDVKAAAVTRYPPALASALEKAAPRSGIDRSLWFADQREGAAPVDARASALRSL